MKIRILGTRGEIKPSARKHSKKSGILIDNQFLFDIGEKQFLKEHPLAIFITHLHPDHSFFTRNPNVSENISIPMYGPESYRKNVYVKKMVRAKIFNRYRITPIPTHHSIKVASQAYLITKNVEKILVTGDLVWIDKKYHHKLKGCDLIITDASYLRKGGLVRRDIKTGMIYGHNGIPDLIRLFSPFTRNILFTHFGSWFYANIPSSKRKLIYLGKKFGVNLLIGFDGMDLVTKDLKK